jgi:Holliday junction resolvasome RuvABC DNA-binding subunit
MNEVTSVLFATCIFIVPLILGLRYGIMEQQEKINNMEGSQISLSLTVTRPQKVQPDNTSKLLLNEAKDVLKDMGFSATEAKKILNEVGPCNDVDEWVRKSLEVIKV